MGHFRIKVIIQKVLINLIRLYRVLFSALLGHCCRFEPSCSIFAIEAIQTYGSVKGVYLTLSRLLRCHPWHPGGIDRIPSKNGH